MKFKKLICITGLAVLFAFNAQAAEVDVLINKLVEKGVLTPLEAQIMLDETKNQVAQDIAGLRHSTLPSWVQKTKIKGDLRLRYQKDINDNATDRDRGRLRYRIGFESKVNNQYTVGAGLASGGSDPRSTNETLDNTFDTPDIRLDYAYVKYSPFNKLDIYGGKFKRKDVLWAPTDLLWDGDINPEGLSLVYNNPININYDVFAGTGLWILDEYSSDSNDPAMWYIQAGGKADFDGTYGKLAGTYYQFENINQALGGLDNASGTNTLGGDNYYAFDYDTIVLSAEVGTNKLYFPKVAAFMDYVHNPDPDNDENGYAIGFKFGDSKVSKKGQWQTKYIFADLERDAWLDTFPDSDRFGGRTDVKGHEVALNYALANDVIFGIDYYSMERNSNSDDTNEILQSDILMKF